MTSRKAAMKAINSSMFSASICVAASLLLLCAGQAHASKFEKDAEISTTGSSPPPSKDPYLMGSTQKAAAPIAKSKKVPASQRVKCGQTENKKPNGPEVKAGCVKG
jgi:hypothetical protein